MRSFFEEKLNLLFKLSHSKSIQLRIQVLKLIFFIGKEDLKSNEGILNRYFKTLYEIFLLKEICNSKHIRELLKLLIQSIIVDTNIERIAAFLKRILQTCVLAEPPYITCILIIVSQVLRNKHKLWKIVEGKKGKIDVDESGVMYDFNKRDPHFTQADNFLMHEIMVFTKHYHPTVQKWSKHILEYFNKQTIEYDGDPIIDFSLINFLDKFMTKNPKIQKKVKGVKELQEVFI